MPPLSGLEEVGPSLPVSREEEEKEEPDSDAEDEDHPCIPPLLITWFKAFFPNTPPFVWFFMQLFVCFLLLLTGLETASTSRADYFLARAPAQWSPTTQDAKPPLEVVRNTYMLMDGW